MADLEIPVGYGLWLFYFQHTGIQHTAVSSVGFEVATPPYTQSQLQSALSGWRTALQPLYDNEVKFARAVALIGNDGPAIRYEATGTTLGTRTASQVAPPNVTYLIRKTTQFAGRRYRGRMYLPYVYNAGIQQTGELTSTEQTALSTAVTALSTQLIAAGPNAASFRLLHASSPKSATPAPTTCTLFADDFVATQRRRLERQ